MSDITLEQATRRSRIDYRMRRRALLQQVAAGTLRVEDVTDAHPDLLRAASHIGVAAGEPCPLCDVDLLQVTYTFDDDRRRHPGGRALSPASLERELARWGELEVYVVEVCRACRWHHLLESFVLVAPATGVGTG